MILHLKQISEQAVFRQMGGKFAFEMVKSVAHSILWWNGI